MGSSHSSQEMKVDNKKNISRSLSVAALSAGSAEFLTFPIDTTKVSLQLKNNSSNKMNSVYNAFRVGNLTSAIGAQSVDNTKNIQCCQQQQMKLVSRDGVFSKYYQTMSSIYNQNGIKGFYRGYKPALMRASLNNALSATFYKQIRSTVFGFNTRDCPLHVKLFSGLITGCATQVLAAPTDLLKVRLQADSSRPVPVHNGLYDAMRSIYKSHGISGFYRGLLPSMYRAGFSVAATLGTYDHCKSYVLRTMRWKDNTKTHIVSSSLSGFAASLVSCPFDVIKTRYQSQSISNPLYKTPRQCLSTIVKEEGLPVLYRGFVPMYLRLAPWQLTFFVTFEFLSKRIVGESF